jgi:hypothetical protein
MMKSSLQTVTVAAAWDRQVFVWLEIKARRHVVVMFVMVIDDEKVLSPLV